MCVCCTLTKRTFSPVNLYPHNRQNSRELMRICTFRDGGGQELRTTRTELFTMISGLRLRLGLTASQAETALIPLPPSSNFDVST